MTKLEVAQAWKAKGLSFAEIGERMNLTRGQVARLFHPSSKDKPRKRLSKRKRKIKPKINQGSWDSRTFEPYAIRKARRQLECQ